MESSILSLKFFIIMMLTKRNGFNAMMMMMKFQVCYITQRKKLYCLSPFIYLSQKFVTFFTTLFPTSNLHKEEINDWKFFDGSLFRGLIRLKCWLASSAMRNVNSRSLQDVVDPRLHLLWANRQVLSSISNETMKIERNVKCGDSNLVKTEFDSAS